MVAPQREELISTGEIRQLDKTMGAVRGELETTAEIPQLDKTMGADGRERTTTPERPTAYRYIDSTPAGRDAVAQAVRS
jgi:hypothetical protein